MSFGERRQNFSEKMSTNCTNWHESLTHHILFREDSVTGHGSQQFIHESHELTRILA